MSEPRIYWAVWEDLEEGEDGYRSGAISSEPGGNLYWEDHQIPFVEKSAYDTLKAEVKELKQQLSFTNSNWPHEKKAIDLANRWREMAGRLAETLRLADSRISETQVGVTTMNTYYRDEILNRLQDALADFESMKNGEQK